MEGERERESERGREGKASDDISKEAYNFMLQGVSQSQNCYSNGARLNLFFVFKEFRLCHSKYKCNQAMHGEIDVTSEAVLTENRSPARLAFLLAATTVPYRASPRM